MSIWKTVKGEAAASSFTVSQILASQPHRQPFASRRSAAMAPPPHTRRAPRGAEACDGPGGRGRSLPISAAAWMPLRLGPASAFATPRTSLRNGQRRVCSGPDGAGARGTLARDAGPGPRQPCGGAARCLVRRVERGHREAADGTGHGPVPEVRGFPAAGAGPAGARLTLTGIGPIHAGIPGRSVLPVPVLPGIAPRQRVAPTGAHLFIRARAFRANGNHWRAADV